MNDGGKFNHGDESTHNCCPEILEKMGGKAICCGCTGHKCVNTTETIKERFEKFHDIIEDESVTECFLGDDRILSFIKSEFVLRDKQLRGKIEGLPSFPSQKRVKNFICKEDALSLLEGNSFDKYIEERLRANPILKEKLEKAEKDLEGGEHEK